MDGYQCPRCGRIVPRPFCPTCLISDSGPGVAGWGSFVKKIKKKVKKVYKAVVSKPVKQVAKVVADAPSAVSKFAKEQKKPLVAIGSVAAGGALMLTGVGAPVGLAVMGAGIGASLKSGGGFGKPKQWMLNAGIGAAAGYVAGSVIAYAMAPAATGAIGSGSSAAGAIGEGAALPGISAGSAAGVTAGTSAAAATAPGWATASGLFTVMGALTPVGLALMQKAPQAIPMTADLVEQGVDPEAAANMAYEASAENPEMTPEEAQAAVDTMVKKYKLAGGGMDDVIAKLWSEHKVAVIIGGSVAAVGLLAVLYMVMVPAAPKKALAVG